MTQVTKQALELPPWQEEAWAQLAAVRAAGRLPHALLLHGRSGLGKATFARQFANLCLCESRQDGAWPCNACRGCRLFAAGTHPDLHVVEPEEGKLTLSVDQVRDLARELGLQAHTGPIKVALLTPADAMTPAAANALLKTLEEPPGATVLILVADRPSALPPTIRSRCQGIRFRAPATDDAVRWLAAQSREAAPWPELLALTGGAPLHALALAGSDAAGLGLRLAKDLAGIVAARADPVDVAARWAREAGGLWWGWLERHVGSLLAHALLGEKSGTRHSRAPATLPDYASHLNVTALLNYWDALLQSKRMLQAQANEQLVLESLLIPWAWRLEEIESGGRSRHVPADGGCE